ncbi:MAG: hypothetical protein P1U56_05845 [Saprospiraceae bacterium]|nr:hypothetical protein [Saprospiraceae bacterium]
MYSLLVSTLFIVAMGYLLNNAMRYFFLKIEVDEKMTFIGLLILILIGYFTTFDTTTAYGCIIGLDSLLNPNAKLTSITLSAVSFLVVLFAFLVKNKSIQLAFIIAETTFWLLKLYTYKGGYAVGYGGVPSMPILTYDLIAIAVRLYLIATLIKISTHLVLKIGIIAFLLSTLKILFFV